jgi:hypothetical protein
MVRCRTRPSEGAAKPSASGHYRAIRKRLDTWGQPALLGRPSRHDVAVTEAVVRSRQEWPWGLVLIGDPADQEPLPSTFGDADVISTKATIICKILHQVDGEATVEVMLDGAERGDLVLVYEGNLALVSGEVVVTDAARERAEVGVVPPGDYRVRVWVSERGSPALVAVGLNAS